MKQIPLQPDFLAWRTAARDALRAGFLPSQLDLQDATVPTPLSLALAPENPPAGPPIPQPHTSRAFLDSAKIAAVHRDPQRWNLLYRILFRLQSNRHLLALETDDDILLLTRLESQVRRDLHKMHAFVRFRKVLEPGDPTLPEDRPTVLDEPIPISLDPHAKEQAHHLVLETPTPFGPLKTELESCPPEEITPDKDCEHFIAWYQPDHRILPLAAPFFAERFAIMRWTILTPDASVSWDPIAKQLVFGPGVPRESAPPEDELEDLWRTYYASIFNPARLNPAAMKSEMPVRYWPNLPELSLLPNLITQSRSRVQTMVARQKSQPTAQPFVPPKEGNAHTLPILAAALPTCQGCDLHRHATQAVPGRGPATAALMLVGEQPGDQEDLQGLPFIGPAGAVLDEILNDLRIPRAQLYVTNAVKHFKFVQRGKLRLHQNPRMSEISACRPWLLAEIEAVNPKVILCLGASASKSLLGGTFALMKDHGKPLQTSHASNAIVMATIHPSAVLRARDQPNRIQLRHFLAEDLAAAWQAVHAQP